MTTNSLFEKASHLNDVTPKIIGNGMVARAFANGLRLNSNLVIFASGVSNSNCNFQEQFERERSLLFNTINKTSQTVPLLYFGTCSIYDPDAHAKAYVIHKREMEKLVLKFKLESNICFVGRLDHSEVRKYYANEGHISLKASF